ncbi:hypothetical protein Tco_1254258 [Tanacetum coccineum]
MSKRARTSKSTKGQSSSSQETIEDRRVGLYSETKGGETSVANTLRNALMVRKENMLLLFWPTIGDGEFTIRSMVARMIRDPRMLGTAQDMDDQAGSIDPFTMREANYPPFGYTRPMPPGYDYRYDTAPDASS